MVTLGARFPLSGEEAQVLALELVELLVLVVADRVVHRHRSERRCEVREVPIPRVEGVGHVLDVAAMNEQITAGVRYHRSGVFRRGHHRVGDPHCTVCRAARRRHSE